MSLISENRKQTCGQKIFLTSIVKKRKLKVRFNKFKINRIISKKLSSTMKIVYSRNKDEVATKPTKQADKQKADSFSMGLNRLKNNRFWPDSNLSFLPPQALLVPQDVQ